MKITLRTVVAVSTILLVFNAGYIWAFASPTIFYMGNVLAHLVVGLVFLVSGVMLLARDTDLRRRLPIRLSAVAMLAAFAFGSYLVYEGNLREMRWALQAHIAASIAGVIGILWYAWRRANQQEGLRQFAAVLMSAVVFLAALPTAATIWARTHPDPRHRIVNPSVAPLTAAQEGGGPSSPFFPSSAKTNVGGIIPSNFFMDSELCGECHKDVYEQWKSSAHHFASFNNQFYRKSIEYMQSVTGTESSKWCAGCHDHAVFFNGRFEKPIKDQIDTPEAQAGLACTSCHSITHVEGTMGNGGFTIEYPPLHELATSRNPVLRRMDRFLTYLNPEPHRRLVHQALHAAGPVGLLLRLSQGASRRARERLSMVPWIQRLRQLAGERVRRRCALVLLPAERADVCRLPHDARQVDRSWTA